MDEETKAVEAAETVVETPAPVVEETPKPVKTKVNKASIAVKEIDVGEMLAKQRELEERLATLTKEYESVRVEKDKIVAEKIERSVNEKLLSIAKSNNMVDPEDILPYYKAKVKIARDGSVVLSDKTDKSLEDDVKEFLAKKPHLVKANIPQSTGAKPTPEGTIQTKTAGIDLSTNQGLTEFARQFMKRR